MKIESLFVWVEGYQVFWVQGSRGSPLPSITSQSCPGRDTHDGFVSFMENGTKPPFTAIHVAPHFSPHRQVGLLLNALRSDITYVWYVCYVIPMHNDLLPGEKWKRGDG